MVRGFKKSVLALSGQSTFSNQKPKGMYSVPLYFFCFNTDSQRCFTHYFNTIFTLTHAKRILMFLRFLRGTQSGAGASEANISVLCRILPTRFQQIIRKKKFGLKISVWLS